MSEEIDRLKQMVEIACDVLKEEAFDALRNYDDATCDGMCISDDLKSAFNAHIDTVDALLKAEREKTLREAAENFRELEMFGSATECEALISKDATP